MPASPPPEAPPSPDAELEALGPREIGTLESWGRQWGTAYDENAAALPIDPSLHRRPELPEPSRWGRITHVPLADGGSEVLEAAGGGLGRRVRAAIFGPPLRSSVILQERMRKIIALPVLSADALSSVAYGPEAMLAILVLAGAGGLNLSVPLAAAIAAMMLAVGVSYRQTIRAYPQGGGSYIVASQNLGRLAGMVAAAGLVTDYVLTVTISISAGLDAVSSAVPALHSVVVPVGLATIAVLLAANLRGVRQAGALFAAPTYAFIVSILLLVIVGLLEAARRGFQVLPPPALHPVQGVGLLLVLRAFASGATAMTGVEAIANAVPAFKPTEWRNARTTLTWMLALLLVMFAGIIALVHLDGVIPQSGQTVLSQLAHLEFGDGPLYWLTQAATALVLLLAANTAYNDFPRVMFLLARDGLAARRFLRMGDRLAFTHGVLALSTVAALLFVIFRGNTESLIPLYAVGVFLAFTLSQAGMVVHWWRRRGPGWRRSIVFNALGCLCSAVVFLVAGITKFAAGAWVGLVIVVGFTAVGLRVRRHFVEVSDALAGPERTEAPSGISNLGIIPVARLNQASARALAYAASMSQPVLALHISPTTEEADRFRKYWDAWGNHVPLTIVQSPYRAVVAPLITYIEDIHAQRPDLTITVIVPELVVRHWWQRSLHEATAARLRKALLPLPNIVVTSVPFTVGCAQPRNRVALRERPNNSLEDKDGHHGRR